MDPYTFLEKVLPESGTWYRGATNIPRSNDDVPADRTDFEAMTARRRKWEFRSCYGQTLHEVGATILSKQEDATTRGLPNDAYYCISTSVDKGRGADVMERCKLVYIDLDVREGGDREDLSIRRGSA